MCPCNSLETIIHRYFSRLILFYIVKFENISSDQFSIKCPILLASKIYRYSHLKRLVLKVVLFRSLPVDETKSCDYDDYVKFFHLSTGLDSFLVKTNDISTELFCTRRAEADFAVERSLFRGTKEATEFRISRKSSTNSQRAGCKRQDMNDPCSFWYCTSNKSTSITSSGTKFCSLLTLLKLRVN